MEEILKILDIDGKPTGEYLSRSEANQKDNVYFRTIFC
jgi:hypothetical protein